MPIVVELSLPQRSMSSLPVTVALPFRSTAENLAKMFYAELKARIPGVSSVKVWETADSCAEFRG